MTQIYALTDAVLTPNSVLTKVVQALLRGGVKIVQYRDKSFSCDEGVLRELAQMCRENDAKFIINDNAKLALKVGASGVHLGAQDGSVRQARELLGEVAFVGVSCYASLELAKKAVSDGASYIAFGAAFASPTKPNAPLCGLEILAHAQQTPELKGVPNCIIGGLSAKNAALVASFKPDYAAFVSALYEGANSLEENIAANLAKLNRALNGEI